MSTQPHPKVHPDSSSRQESGILPRLLHEMRQPLCGIESIAYYLEIALDDQDDAIRNQCGKLRAMVRQASWLLDDAALGAAAPSTVSGAACPNRVVLDIAERLALHDERPLNLDLSDHLPRAAAGESRLRRFVEHILCFFHEVAEVAEPVRIRSREEGPCCALLVSGRVNPDRRRELGALFESLHPDGLAAALASIGGSLEVAWTGDFLEVNLLLPTATDD